MRKILILLFLLTLFIAPCLAYNETYLTPQDKYVYPESYEIYGYAHYNNGTLVTDGSKVVASNKYGVEVGKSYVNEDGKYGVESRKIYDENKLSADSEFNYYNAGGYRTLEFNDTICFWIHTNEMKDKLFLKTNEETIFASNEIIFINLTIPQIENSQLKYPKNTYSPPSEPFVVDMSKVINPIDITPVAKDPSVTGLDINTQNDPNAEKEGGVVETPMDFVNIILIVVSVIIILVCVIFILIRKGIIEYDRGNKIKRSKPIRKKKSRLKFLHKVDNSFDEDLVALCEYANYMHDDVEPDILVLWKYCNFYEEK